MASQISLVMVKNMQVPVIVISKEFQSYDLIMQSSSSQILNLGFSWSGVGLIR